jgi:hypothetical protein
MRLFICIWSIAMVAGLVPAVAQKLTQAEAAPAFEASASLPSDWLPPGRVGQVSLVSGNVELRGSSGGTWADAELNQPIFAGEALRTDARARGEIRIGANTIDLSNGGEIEISSLRDGITQILLSRGRIGLDLRQAGENETVQIDVPQGAVRLLAPGTYDIETADGKGSLRVAVFDGMAQYAGAGGDRRIERGQIAVLTGSESADTASTEPATADDFVAWCRAHDHDETHLAAPYYISRYMTGYDELDGAGIWKINAQYGPVWFPTQSEDWAPYRFGHWSWIAPWGWTWLDDQPWGFAPSHFGRWALIDDHWAWVPGNYVVRPLYAPAVVAFLGTPGVGLSSEEGATVAWFPLAPGEAYWPSYTRDLDYVRNLNFGIVKDVSAIGIGGDGEPPLETFHQDFANRLLATVVPRLVFTNGRPVPFARVSLPEKRLQNAPVLMASPQIAPASAQRVARAAKPNPPVTHAIVQLSRKGGAKPIRTASIQLRGRAQPIVLRGAHLHAPAYAGQPRGRQMVVLRVAHSRGGPGKKG